MKPALSDAISLLCASVLTLAMLYITAAPRADLPNLAKGAENTSRSEQFKNSPYTASTVDDIAKLTIARSKNGDDRNPSFTRVLWLGNSQLHYINQYHDGDHLAPYWLRMKWGSPADIEPLGFSLPNANFQELLVLSRYVITRLPVRLLLVELVFDDLREDDLRSDFAAILTPREAEEIAKSSTTAKNIVRRFLGPDKAGEDGQGNGVLSGTVQRPVEQWLNERLSNGWRLWAARPLLEGNVYLAFYRLRNKVFGIKPTSTRRMIRARYDSNMVALQDMLADAQQRKIPTLLYVAPIRQDRQIPYDPHEYRVWKDEVSQLTRRFGARVVNLEALVPGNMWGSYLGDELDFMHFQGPGHRLVAEALLPHIMNMTEAR